jgi:hypothetical protein
MATGLTTRSYPSPCQARAGRRASREAVARSNDRQIFGGPQSTPEREHIDDHEVESGDEDPGGAVPNGYGTWVSAAIRTSPPHLFS